MEEMIMTTDDVMIATKELPVMETYEEMPIVETYEEMPVEEYYDAPMYEEEKSGISSTVILWIVIGICAVAGVALGILVGKKTASK